MKRLSVAIALTLCLVLPASAQMYKWVDENGKVHYSDKPPPSNIKIEKLRRTVTSAPAPSEVKGGAAKDAAKAGPMTLIEQDQAFRKRQQEAAKAEQEAAQKQAQAREREQNCKRAKIALAQYQAGGLQMRINEKGERVYLDEKQIAQDAERARQDVAKACN
ncbi:MAG: DUF4124 domain-containing protein [Pseudomonadota bacterium]